MPTHASLKPHRQEGYETHDGAFWVRRLGGKAWGVYDKRDPANLYGGALVQIVTALVDAVAIIKKARR